MSIATDLKTAKKGESVHMYAFTGMYIGEFEINAADKKSITITQKNGRVTKFDRETGKQLEAKTPRCASKVTTEKIEKKAKPAKKTAKTTEAATEKAEATPAKTEKKAAAKTEEPAPKRSHAKKVTKKTDSDDEYEEA